MGRASGTMAAMSMLGSLCGFSVFGFALSAVHAYWIYCVALLLAIAVTCVVAKEKVRGAACVSAPNAPAVCASGVCSRQPDHRAPPA